ncbi:protein boule-like [Rhopilema esculentum]|uniref:protein boule-like n=1 Tax=Rhopilema esculentum TaxID=499914 RepID=UPI0031DB2327
MDAQTIKSVNSMLALHFPHRIFVGSLTRETTPAEIAEFFRNFGVVIESKIILDSNGCSRGFGFVSFDSKDAVANVLKQGTIYLKGRKITIAPAVKKHNIQETLPADIKPTKYFTKKGTVKQLPLMQEVRPLPDTPRQVPLPQVPQLAPPYSVIRHPSPWHLAQTNGIFYGNPVRPCFFFN